MTAGYLGRLRRLAADDDAAFAEYLSEGELVFPRHLREISVFADRHDKCLVLEPRGHAKTTLFIHRVARRIGQSEGHRRFGILTAVSGDADARSAAIRRLVEQRRFAEVFGWARRGVAGTPWSDDAWTVRGVELGKDHTLVAMGLGAVRAGPRLDELIADDMVGYQENATSAQRQKALEVYLAVVDPMVVPGGRRTFLGTRWHEDDIYHHLIERSWPHLVRAALEEGAALWPDHYTTAILAAKRLEMGSALFDLQYQNDPSGMGGNILRREWFKSIRSLPLTGLRRGGMDLAASAKERSDYTAYVEVFEDTDLNLYICGSWRSRLDQGHRAWLTGVDDAGLPLDSMAKGPCLLWPLGRLPGGYAGARGVASVPRALASLNIEATIFQSTFSREVLAKTRLPARAMFPDKDKVTRSRTLAARMEAGKVYFLEGAPGIDELQSEMVGFPNVEHDDQVDALVYAADLNPTSEWYVSTAGRY